MATPHVLAIARQMIFQETRENRREAVLSEFDNRARAAEQAFQGHPTHLRQLLATTSLGDLNSERIDLRQQRERRGPSDGELLKEYKVLVGEIERLFSEAGLGRRRRFEAVSRVMPDVPEKVRVAALHNGPSRVAYEILGWRYALSWERVRDRCTGARKAEATP